MLKENIKEVIKDQREWILRKDNFTTRDKQIKPMEGFAVVISGIRRCGKSTLLAQTLKKEKVFYYLNLEDPRLNNMQLEDLNKVTDIFNELHGKNGVYFLDEIQNIESWEKYIRYLIDHKNKVILTGSNASLLSKELGTRLTGRHLRKELFPFSYNEFLSFNNSKPSEESFQQYLYDGGFPEYLKTKDQTIMHELLNDVVLRDIAVRHGIRNTNTLKKMATYLVSHVGKPFSSNSLKKMFEINSTQTIIEYISFLEDSYIIFTIPLFSYSYKKQQINPKKAYSIDNGFSYCNSITFSKDKGKMLENCVFLHLRRFYDEIFYFTNQGECDFLIKEKYTEAIQVCYNLNEENYKRETEGLLEAMKELKLSHGTILTFSQEDEITIKNKKITVKPVWKWLTAN